VEKWGKEGRGEDRGQRTGQGEMVRGERSGEGERKTYKQL